ncbi:LLM class F420-dependent oxidoreductase [Pseudonocardia sp. NPDC049154]|uniref:LLM class F420-dependent oxidoreductase n=1 Tax=Pseudonocardia sp. NPDC049154 TaxID=3155501 RepID=UPI0034005877
MNYGLSIPLGGRTLKDHAAVLDRAVMAGYTDVWSSEVNGHDAFTPLALAAQRYPGLRLGTAITPAYTRSPALLAMSAASLADSTDGQVLLGVGSSSDVIVERWNGVPFHDPYGRVRDVVTFLDRALTGEKVDMETPSFTIKGFRLGVVPQNRPKVLVAGLRPGMLRLAGRRSDGAILNWLSPDDVRTVVPYVYEGRSTAPEIVARLFVVCSSDVEKVREHAKRAIAAYLNVDAYAKFHEWLGRGDELAEMWGAWRAGDRKAALAAIPDSLVDELFIHGDATACRSRIRDYVDAGITTPMLAITNLDGDAADLIDQLGRRVGDSAGPAVVTAGTATKPVDPIVAQDRQRWGELGWPQPTAMSAFMSLFRTHERVLEVVRKALKQHGLSITEHSALLHLAMAPDHSSPLSRMAERLLISPARCNYVVNRLESEGWVERKPHPADGRSTLAVLTESGAAKVDRSIAAVDGIDFGFRGTREQELNDLVDALAACGRVEDEPAGDADRSAPVAVAGD